MTGTELAKAAGLGAVTVSRLERTNNDPTEETVQALAKALDYPIEFFYSSDVDEVTKEAASFRSLKAMTAREREAALSAASLAFLVSDWVDERFALPEPSLPDMANHRDPETAARQVRSAWNLGVQPIGNMIDLLEAKGVRVFSLSENTLTVDAFSCWRNDIPYVFLNTFKSSEHSRFDAAHELGHLCLHRHGIPPQKDAENEANAFASEFLMPKEDVESRILHVRSLSDIMKAKQRWRVSLMAMAYRLSKLEITTEWQARQFYIQINRLGYRTNEPEPIDRETSFVWQTIFRELWKERFTKHKLAESLHIPPEELEGIVFGLTSPVFDPRSRLDAAAGYGLHLAVEND